MPAAMYELDDFGTVISWDAHRGFGFLRGDHGKDIFVGRSELLHSGIKNLQAGMRLAFRVRRDNFGKAPRAMAIRVLSEAPA